MPKPTRLPGLLLLIALTGCSAPPYPRGTLEELFPDGRRPLLRTFAGERPLLVAEVLRSGSPRIIFIHGSPGDWRSFARYLDHPALQGFGPLLAADRPGFGGSGAGAVLPELRAQAAALAPLLDGPGAPAIVVGHSLGGAVALRLAVDYPQSVRGVLLLAGSVAPQFEQPRWYNELARWRLLQPLIPDALLWSNRELYGLPQELQQLAQAWPQLRAPVYVVQGRKDALVDPRTADYLEQALAAAPHHVWRVADEGHFLLWTRPEIVVTALQALIAASDHAAAAAAAGRERSATNGVE